MKKRGRFITLEGGEGVGKSTLIRALGYSLEREGYSCLLTYQPGATALGKKLRELLLDQSDIKLCDRAELLLFLSDKSQHISQMLLPALEKNDFVICDRFIDSAIAYQGSKFEEEIDLFNAACRFATKDLTADLTFVLDIDPVEGKKRILARSGGKLDTIEKKDMSYHQLVRKAFLKQAKQDPDRYVVLDASKTPEEVVAGAMHVLSKKGFV